MFFLFWCLAVIGLTHIIVDSHIVQHLKHKLFYKTGEDGLPTLRDDLSIVQKELEFMLRCYQCTGFWVGLVLGVWLNPIDTSFFWWPFMWLGYAFAGSFLGPLGAALLNYLDVAR